MVIPKPEIHESEGRKKWEYVFDYYFVKIMKFDTDKYYYSIQPHDWRFPRISKFSDGFYLNFSSGYFGINDKETLTDIIEKAYAFIEFLNNHADSLVD